MLKLRRLSQRSLTAYLPFFVAVEDRWLNDVDNCSCRSCTLPDGRVSARKRAREFKEKMTELIKSTTVILVRRDSNVAMAADGQVTLGETIIKHSARKIRRLAGGDVIAGFAGATADAFTLLSKFETKLGEFQGQLERAAFELGKEWRTDKYLRNLEALLIVADKSDAFLVSGKGDVISSDDGLLSVGSGSMYALSAARALMKHTELSAREIAEESMRIAGEICIYTNSDIVVEEL